MKQILKHFAIILIVFFQSTPDAAAQLNRQDMNTEREIELLTDEKLHAAGDKNPETGTPDACCPNVEVRFRKFFPEASSPVWNRYGHYFFADFYNHGRKVMAVFSRKGAMEFAITQLDKNEIPPATGKLIADEYQSYPVFNVKQIVVGSSTVYQVILENSREFITLYTTEEEIVSSRIIQKPGF